MKHTDFDKSFQNIFENIQKAFTSTNFYWELAAVVLCLVIGGVAYRAAKKIYLERYRDYKKYEFIKQYLAPLAMPLSIFIALAIGSITFSFLFKENFLFFTLLQLIALFVFLRFLRLIFNNSLVANLVAIFLIPTILLNILGLLEPIIFFLDQFAINLGKVRISIYTVIQAIFILSIVFWISSVVSKKSKSYFSSRPYLRTTTKGIINKTIDIAVYFIVFVVILQVFGVDMTTFTVIGGAIGVGIGFGLQKIASNFISGMVLLMEKSIEIGDIVELDNGNIYGTVTHFGGRYTLIETMDGKEIMVPNEDFIIGKVTNWTFNNHRVRLDIKIAIATNSDVKKARDIMLRTANEHPRCLKFPEAECFVENITDNKINIILYFWVGDIAAGRMGPKSDVLITILDRFKENNIEIPYQQLKVVSN